MRNFKVFNSAFLSEPDPSDKPVKAKAVFSVFKLNVNELNRQPFTADLRIERRSKNRGEQHINTRMNRRFNEAFNERPKFLAENGNLIIIRY